ncbi:MAG: formyltransferase family protein [Pseudolabrys sp.]
MTKTTAVSSAPFDTIILLAQSPESETLAGLLRQHNPQIVILTPADKADLMALAPETLSRARIIGFLTPIVVPAAILEALGYGAYNIHPGPPSHPGWLPSHFAVYQGTSVFGATAHVMIEEIDAGPIVGIELFNVPVGTSVEELERLTFMRCARLIWRLAPALARDPTPLQELPLRWSGRRSTKAMVREACDIAGDVAADELERRIAGFGGGHSGVAPTVTLHGHTFRYVPPAANAADQDAIPAAAADKQVA